MAVTQYIGSRYVPLLADPVAWSSTKEYEPLTIVTHEGNSYTSRQFVPVGIDISNEEFWAMTGNYNAQVELYRREINTAVQHVEDVAQEVLDSAVYFIFDTVAELKAYDGNFPREAAIYTRGYDSIGDGGGALYRVTPSLVANDYDIIAAGNTVVSLVPMTSAVNVRKYGATGTTAEKDTGAFKRAFEVAEIGGKTIHIPCGEYHINEQITIFKGANIYGDGEKTVINASGQYLFYATVSNLDNVIIKELKAVCAGGFLRNNTGEISVSMFESLQLMAGTEHHISAAGAIEVVNFNNCRIYGGSKCGVYATSYMYFLTFNHCWFSAISQTYVWSDSNTEVVAFNSCEFQGQNVDAQYDDEPALFFRWARDVKFESCYFENCHRTLVKNDTSVRAYSTNSISFIACHFTRSNSSTGYSYFVIDTPIASIMQGCECLLPVHFANKTIISYAQPTIQLQNNSAQNIGAQNMQEDNISSVRHIVGTSRVFDFNAQAYTNEPIVEFRRANTGARTRKSVSMITGKIRAYKYVISADGFKQEKAIETDVFLHSLARSAYSLEQQSNVIINAGTTTLDIDDPAYSISGGGIDFAIAFTKQQFGTNQENEGAYITFEYDLTITMSLDEEHAFVAPKQW